MTVTLKQSVGLACLVGLVALMFLVLGTRLKVSKGIGTGEGRDSGEFVTNADQVTERARSLAEKESRLRARWREIAERKQREQKIDALLSAAPLFDLNGTGGLDSRVAEQAGLTDEEKQNVDELLHRTWEWAIEDFSSRCVLDEVSSDPDSGMLVYEARARPDRGMVPVKELRNSLTLLVGEDKQRLLTVGMDGGGTLFQSFGRLDARFEIDVTRGTYKCEFLSPVSGEVREYSQENNLSDLPREYAIAFEKVMGVEEQNTSR